jgi:hypothetical protein
VCDVMATSFCLCLFGVVSRKYFNGAEWSLCQDIIHNVDNAFLTYSLRMLKTL